jgi:DNA-binding MarR family transcriptional regulator
MNFRPDEAIGYWLFYTQRCVEYAFLEVLRQCCLEQGKSYMVTPPQWGVLALLYEDDGMTIGTISQRRGFDAPTITGIVKRLEQSGLVERCHDRADRRVVKVYLTAEGREIMPFLMEAVSSFGETTTRGFSTTEKKDFLLKLQQIIENMSLVAAGTGDRFNLLPGHLLHDPQ